MSWSTSLPALQCSSVILLASWWPVSSSVVASVPRHCQPAPSSEVHNQTSISLSWDQASEVDLLPRVWQRTDFLVGILHYTYTSHVKFNIYLVLLVDAGHNVVNVNTTLPLYFGRAVDGESFTTKSDRSHIHQHCGRPTDRTELHV
jgi:hypothetical protein